MDLLRCSVALKFSGSMAPLPSETGRTLPEDGTRAWLLPGSRVDVWLDELSHWGVPLSELRLLILPASSEDPTAHGVLVLAANNLRPRVSPFAQPYACRAGRLYLPAEAALNPELTDREVQELLAPPLAVLHPGIGAVGFSEDETVTVAALLTAGGERTANWNRACPGPAVRDRIESVLPDAPPDLATILRAAQDDIGLEALRDAPPQPGEGKGVLGSATDSLKQMAARMAKSLAGAMPAAGSSGGLGSSLARWAAQMAAGVNRAQQLEQLRRLLQMLNADPEQGLRFALPLTGDAHRGRGPGGSSLMPRDLNFDLGRLLTRGSGPGDPWVAPPELYQALHQRYRALAEREMQLGRYRRAAYIYAELLGDLSSAVAALKRGRHFREAAILYKDRLNNVVEAANCYVEGGLLEEAVLLYEEKSLFEKAGDLWVRMERLDKAEVAYRKVVAEHLRGTKLLLAAELLERKLNVPDEALQVLASGWPPHVVYFKALCDLLGRLGRHDEATAAIRRLRAADYPSSLQLPLAQSVAELANHYPHEETRATAADVARVLVSRALQQFPEPSAISSLVAALTSLAPNDRMLSRDGRRYVASPPAAPAPKAAPRTASLPRLESEWKLPPLVAWTAAASVAGHTCVAGHASFGPVVALQTESLSLCNWVTTKAPGSAGSPPTPREPLTELVRRTQEEPPLLLAAAPTLDHNHVLHPLGTMLEIRPLIEYDTGDVRRKRGVGTPDWFPPNVLGCAWHSEHALWLVQMADDRSLVLSLYETSGHLIFSRGVFTPTDPQQDAVSEDQAVDDLTETVWDIPTHLTGRDPVPMAAAGSTVFLGLGTHLLRTSLRGNQAGGLSPSETGRPWRFETLARPIHAIACSPATSHRRLAVAFDRGGALLDAESLVVKGEFLPRSPRPAIGFLHDGRLVAASEDTGVIQQPNGRLAEWTLPKMHHLVPQVIPTNSANGFALIGIDGMVKRFLA